MVLAAALNNAQHLLCAVILDSHRGQNRHLPNIHTIYHDNGVIILKLSAKKLRYHWCQPRNKPAINLAFAGIHAVRGGMLCGSRIFAGTYPAQELCQHCL